MYWPFRQKLDKSDYTILFYEKQGILSMTKVRLIPIEQESQRPPHRSSGYSPEAVFSAIAATTAGLSA